MSKVTVLRDQGTNAIIGVFYGDTGDPNPEVIDDENAEVQAFISRPIAVTWVSARQFRLMLRRRGLIDQVKGWVAQQDGEVQDAFEYSGTFVKDSPMMKAGFAALGFSQYQIDEFFAAASRL
ncbi:UNVERIFIED_ORG: hypothetical protein GGE64_004405 [Rhizobium etli]